MGEPVIINDGSPVKISWHGKHGWTADQAGLSLTRDGNFRLDWILFNLLDKVDVKGQLQLKVNFKLKGATAGQTLLVTTDAQRKNLRLTIDNLPAGQRFSNFFAPPRNGGNKLRTLKDASITGISYTIGGGAPQKAGTLKLLPTTIILGLEDA
jgi:hypothetical protein